MKRSFIYIFLLCLFILPACFTPQELIEPVEILTANKWVLCKMNDESISLADFEKGTPYLKFEKDGKLVIFTGCNVIDGIFVLNGHTLDVDFDSKDISCKNHRASDFLDLLKSSTRFTTIAQQLVLADRDMALMFFFPK